MQIISVVNTVRGLRSIMKVGYKEFFKDITNYNPYPYQERVFSLLSDNKSVVLRAPTGSGKTLAVLMPVLYYNSLNTRLVDRVIYALPMRALAFDLYNSTIKTANDAGLHASSVKRSFIAQSL
jgi:CRISPR/Cas system-associated endonuclease/helicase Cas3